MGTSAFVAKATPPIVALFLLRSCLHNVPISSGGAKTNMLFVIEAIVAQLEQSRENGVLGHSTGPIAEMAERRGVSIPRLDHTSPVQLGRAVGHHRIPTTRKRLLSLSKEGD